MQLLKSLICLQGNDNRIRFLLISAASYLGLLALTVTFSSFTLFAFILLALLSSLVGLTTRRRLRDAHLKVNLFVGPSLAFALSALVILLSGHGASYALLLLPLLCTGFIFTYASKAELKYILGYNGPVDLVNLSSASHAAGHQQSRIEPTILDVRGGDFQQDTEQPLSQANRTEEIEDIQMTGDVINQRSSSQNTQTPNQGGGQDQVADFGEVIRVSLLKNRKLIGALVIAFILLVIGFTSSLFDGSPKTLQLIDQPEVETDIASSRLDPVTFPDGFSIMLSPYQGVIVNWQGDVVANNTLWSLDSAQGDNSCQEVRFNNGDKIRTLSVLVEKDTNYYASFSPLDTQKLLNSIAFRADFSLCGYKFSLKGSQAVLGKSAPYAEIIEY